jgi:4-amino-4-deoxy-L-arabinose transferase-like glycosyltransferase
MLPTHKAERIYLHPSTLAKRGTILLFLATAIFYFYGLGYIPLLGPDEPRYAQVAREMFLRHDLVTPTLGGHTWFEKPALLYWMMIASFKLFGVSEWAARLPGCVSGLLTIAAVYCIGRKVEAGNEKLTGYAFWSALAAVATLGIAVFSRAVNFDIILTMTLTWALTFLILHELEETAQRRRWFLVGFYVLVGLSLLAKGLVGIVIPFAVAGLYYLFRRRLPERNAFISLFWGIPLTLVVASTWYAPVISRHGWTFIDQFFIQHHFARYVSNKYHHSGPFYYYLLVIPLLGLPWTAFIGDGLVQLARRIKGARVSSDDPSGDRLHRLLLFVLAWLLFPLLFFSFSNSKLPGYILPVMPGVALIVGERLRRLSSELSNNSWAIKTTAFLCLLVASGALTYAWATGNIPLACAVLIAAPLFIAGTFALLSRSQPSWSIVLIACAVVTVMIVALRCIAPQVVDLESSRRLLQLADARGFSKTVIYGIQRSDRTPEFYASGRVVYGADGEAIMYGGPFQVIAESQRRKDFVLAFVPLKELSQLTAMPSAQIDVIGDNGRYAIVAVNYQKQEQ